MSDETKQKPELPPELVIVRHGEAGGATSEHLLGRSDVHLTETGREHAERLGERLRDRAFRRVLVSPLHRARETCGLAGFGERAEIVDELIEWDFGDYEELNTEEIRERVPGWSLWREGVPGGETPADVGGRIDRVLSSVAAVDGPVLVFSHGEALSVLAARWLRQPPEAGAHLYLFPASISELSWRYGEPIVLRWNGTALADR